MVDCNRPAREVHTLPSQPGSFAAPQAVYCGQHECRLRWGRAGLLDKAVELFLGKGPPDVLFPLGQDDIIRGVMIDQALDDRIFHALMNNCVKFQDGRRGVPLFIFFVNKGLKVVHGYGAECQMPCMEERMDVPAEHVPVAIQRILPDLGGHDG